MRETGPVNLRLSSLRGEGGDYETEIRYQAIARTLLGSLKNRLRLGGIAVGAVRQVLADGTEIVARSVIGTGGLADVDSVFIKRALPVLASEPPPIPVEVIEEPIVPTEEPIKVEEEEESETPALLVVAWGTSCGTFNFDVPEPCGPGIPWRRFYAPPVGSFRFVNDPVYASPPYGEIDTDEYGNELNYAYCSARATVDQQQHFPGTTYDTLISNGGFVCPFVLDVFNPYGEFIACAQGCGFLSRVTAIYDMTANHFTFLPGIVSYEDVLASYPPGSNTPVGAAVSFPYHWGYF